MSNQKSDDKKKKKTSQLVIRIDAGERDAFVKLCDALDTSGAREIRRFMREWVATHAPKPDAGQQSGGTTDVVDIKADAAATPEPEETAVAEPGPKSKRKHAVDATA